MKSIKHTNINRCSGLKKFNFFAFLGAKVLTSGTKWGIIYIEDEVEIKPKPKQEVEKMLVKVNVNEILEFVRDGEDCRLEIDKDGWHGVIGNSASGYPDTVLKQKFYAYDYEECENEEEYIQWLIDCYYQEHFETEDGQEFTIEITR